MRVQYFTVISMACVFLSGCGALDNYNCKRQVADIGSNGSNALKNTRNYSDLAAAILEINDKIQEVDKAKCSPNAIRGINIIQEGVRDSVQGFQNVGTLSDNIRQAVDEDSSADSVLIRSIEKIERGFLVVANS